MLIGMNIVNVERVKIVTRASSPATHIFETMTSFNAEPHVEKGEEKVQRVKNVIMGRLKTDDLIGGYDIDCEDERIQLEIIALVNGGTYSSANGYAGPAPGTPTVRTPFDLYLYSSNRDTDGSVADYIEFKFPNCKGTPVKLAAKDGDFTKQTYKIESRPASTESTVDINVVEELPSAD